MLRELKLNQGQIINRFKKVCEFEYALIEGQVLNTPTAHTQLSAHSIRESLTPTMKYFKKCLEKQGYETHFFTRIVEKHIPREKYMVKALSEIKEEWEARITNEIYPIIQEIWKTKPIKYSFIEETNKMAKEITKSTSDPDMTVKFIHDARRAVETFLQDDNDTIGVTAEELPIVPRSYTTGFTITDF